MGFKKITKEEWMALNPWERDHLRLEFDKSVESRKRWALISTRSIALLCVVALFFIGAVQLGSYNDYGKIFDQYGPQAHCYLCGLEVGKQCGCFYQKTMDYGNILVDYNETKIKQDLADSNVEKCATYDEYIKSLDSEVIKKFKLNISGPQNRF